MSTATNFKVEEASKPSHLDPAQKLRGYSRIVLLTEGFSEPYYAKTAMSVMRYRADDVLAIFDSSSTGRVGNDLFGIGGQTPMVDSLDGLEADALFLGIATPGGKLPESWRPIILDALSRGIDVVSGMHDFLCHDSEFRLTASRNGCSLIDVRKNAENSTSTGVPFREQCTRIHTVGQDCSLGKMVVSLEVQRQLVLDGLDAGFVATGQTGIMIAGEGVPIDCVVADFVNGAAEALVRRNQNHDILLIEGQGSISHPSFSAVTTGLLHGCAPDGLIYCYEVGRQTVKGLDNIKLLPHSAMIQTYESIARLRHPSRVIGIAMNSRNVTAVEAQHEKSRIESEFGLPVCDVYRDGAKPLSQAVRDLRSELIP